MSKKAMQSVMGKINFLQKFIFGYAQIVKPLQETIKKDAISKWDKMEKYAFTQIKQAITNSLALYSPYFGKVFMLYTFASNMSIAVMLTHKDN